LLFCAACPPSTLKSISSPEFCKKEGGCNLFLEAGNFTLIFFCLGNNKILFKYPTDTKSHFINLKEIIFL
jgi:hypothetical protein